jgi:hypothetical protein
VVCIDMQPVSFWTSICSMDGVECCRSNNLYEPNNQIQPHVTRGANLLQCGVPSNLFNSMVHLRTS